MLISPDYLKLNAQLHEERETYGSHGWPWIGPILHFMLDAGAHDLLDYGAGKGLLAKWFPSDGYGPVYCYDPVTFPEEPSPRDFVVMLDVLEHIEPECLDDVLDHVRSKMKKGGFFVIATRPAKKTLSDGRNAHLIVKDHAYWIAKLYEHFSSAQPVEEFCNEGELAVRVKP